MGRYICFCVTRKESDREPRAKLVESQVLLKRFKDFFERFITSETGG